MAEPPVVSFAAVLRRLRDEAGLSQEELAEAAALSTRAVSDLERGVAQTARRDTARLLADALHLTGPRRDWFEAVARGRVADSEAPRQDPGAAAAPRALPRDITSFTGRAAELEQLVGAPASAAGGVVGIHAIGGMAGIGKTTLAVRAAHQLAPRFPDGQIFLPLHGHTPGQRPVDPADALASLLQTIGVGAAQIPAGVEARMAAWRDKVAGRQLLLVLDDAAGSEQVRPLLPGSDGSLVLVTSRRHLTALDDAQAVSLDTLAPDEAAALLLRLAGRPGLAPDDPAVAGITRLCGFLPLAVGMAARQLHHHPAWAAADLAADLTVARDRLEMLHAENLSVAAAFSLSYDELTEDQQRLFRRLGLHPGPDIDGYAAAALDGTDLAGARRLLEGLYDHYLIGEPARGRYRLHDLIREHARALATTDEPADREAATGRLLDYYQHTATLTGGVVRGAASLGAAGRCAVAAPPAEVPDVTGSVPARAWARAERANLLACLDHAASAGQPARVVAFTAALAWLLDLDGPWAEAITRHTAAAQAARRCGDRPGQAHALTDLAAVQMMTGDYQDAAGALAGALAICRADRRRDGEADALSHLGMLGWITGDFPAAAATLEQALAIHRDLGNRSGETFALQQLAAVRYLSDDYPGAAEDAERALRISRELGHRSGEAKALYTLGVVHERTGNYPAAAQALAQAQDIYADLSDRYGEATALGNLGEVRTKTGDLPGAAQALDQALRIFTEFGQVHSRAIALRLLAATRRQTGDLPGAASAIEESLAILTGLGARQEQAEALNEAGTLHRARGDLHQASACHHTALDLARQTGSSWTEACALAGLGRCALATGDPAAARASLAQALDIFQRIGAAEAPAIAAELATLATIGHSGHPSPA